MNKLLCALCFITFTTQADYLNSNGEYLQSFPDGTTFGSNNTMYQSIGHDTYIKSTPEGSTVINRMSDGSYIDSNNQSYIPLQGGDYLRSDGVLYQHMDGTQRGLFGGDEQ